MSLRIEVGRTGLFIQIDDTVLNLNTSQITIVGGGSGGDADTLNGEDGAYYLDRSNHTGTQAISTIDNLQDALDLKLDAADYNDRFKGLFTSYYELEQAWPIANAGDKAQVDWGLGFDVVEYAWDVSDQYWAAIGVASIANTDELPEGSSNLYFTAQRVRNTSLSGLSLLSGLAITAADSVLSAFGKLQAQLSALATVARTGSYNDLINKPTIDDLNTVLHKTTTPLRERKNSGNVSPFDLNLRGMFETNYTFGANTLAVGDCYKIEYLIVVDLVTGQAGSLALTLIINGAVFNLTSELLVPLGVMTTSQHVEGVFNLSVMSIGATGRLVTDGYAIHRNGAIAAYTQSFGSYNTTQPLTVNASVRFSSLPSGANTAYIKSARLIRVNNP